ncbi:fatty acid desaturase [Neisseria sp. HSC-16F19]|nr:fatty acid desaturase [Neisseria sp. HSC-16F19]MCP2040354.1 fatty acid desaturase [Neisseria sp. HSC-16F19]
MKHLPKPEIEWRDLLTLSRRQVALNLALSWPWLAGSWWLAAKGHYLWALPLSFFFYLCALRQAHDAYHRSLGVGRFGTEVMLYALSSTMLCSTHAIRYTHLQHHRDPLGASDVEGNWARLAAWQALLWGPLFSIRTQWQGLRHGDGDTRRRSRHDVWIMAAVWLAAVLWPHPVLVYHVLTMLAANAVVGFFAVWSVHRGCDPAGVFARTERRAWLNFATAHLLYHVEHHLFARVPANHLPELARRLDKQAPQWAAKRVL